jgi:uncharacterized protein (TIGR02466 family)
MEKKLVEIVPFRTTFFVGNLADQSYLIPIIKKIQETDSGEVISNQGGWQSSKYWGGQKEEFEPLCQEVFEYLKSVCQSYDFRLGSKYYLSYWINVNGKYDYNKTHDHPNSVLSAVLYIKVPKNSGTFVMERPDLMEVYWSHVLEKEDRNNDKTYLQWKIDPEPNKLLIFPSWIKHYVEQNLTEDEDDERISIAFNMSV